MYTFHFIEPVYTDHLCILKDHVSLIHSMVFPYKFHCTVEPVLKDHPICHKNVVFQDRWSLVTGLVILKCRSFYRKCMVCQDRWSLMAVVPQDRFHCTQIVDLNQNLRLKDFREPSPGTARNKSISKTCGISYMKYESAHTGPWTCIILHGLPIPNHTKDTAKLLFPPIYRIMRM